jgi:hypothetical protein
MPNTPNAHPNCQLTRVILIVSQRRCCCECGGPLPEIPVVIEFSESFALVCSRKCAQALSIGITPYGYNWRTVDAAVMVSLLRASDVILVEVARDEKRDCFFGEDGRQRALKIMEGQNG